jgi:hypothetical protein
MPKYKVISPGFYEGKYYHPEGKRPVLHTDKPFTKKNPMPAWLTAIPDEDAAVKAKRKSQEASVKAAIESLTESVTEAEAALESANVALESAESDEDKKEAEANVYAAQLNLDNTNAALDSINPKDEEVSTQDQVAVASTETNPDGEGTSFISKVVNAVSGGSDNKNVETL